MPTALLSVYDKSGIVELAAGLHAAGWRIVSSGGTAAAVAAAGVEVTDLADLTGLPAILDHRVVTLHPKVHGGLLADPTNEQHQADMADHGIEPIDLVVVNLYPFSSNPSIELIDIGGPAMVRAAAKNHAHVGVVVNPADYPVVLAEIERDGRLGATTRRRLARDAFAAIAAYDAAIANWFDAPSPETPEALPAGLHLSLERAQTLRYGENPHQQGARYRLAGGTSWWDTAVQHQGKELSYLNLYDTEAAWKLVQRFGRPASVIVKHANPCGVAVAETIDQAYQQANACDPVSAFGGIVAVNRTVTKADCRGVGAGVHRSRRRPRLRPDALAVFAAQAEPACAVGARRPRHRRSTCARSTVGCSCSRPTPCRPTVPHGRWSPTAQPTPEQWDDLVFAWQVCAVVSSNAIVYAKDLSGARHRRRPAEPSRQRPHRGRALRGPCGRRRVRERCVLPVPRRPRRRGSGRHQAVIQPGGSVRDDEVIAAADEHGIAMVFTGERHFRH
jgi:phosphoribosylaminoimidazolecarboxamide formyltransferase/IMP cyclohydrolase